MSLTAYTSSSDLVAGAPRVLLKTSAEYQLWKQRVAGACWASTGLEVFDLTDDKCRELKAAYDDKKGGDKPSVDPIGKCWSIINANLSDDIFLKTSHIPHGSIASLIGEIRATLAVSTVDEIQPLKVELYGATMAKDCGNDLQSYIYYIKSRRDKLLFLGDEIKEPELIHIFLRGLCTVFQPLQVQFALPGMTPDTLDKVIAAARKFSTTPVVTAELAKLKTPNANVMIASNPPRSNTNRPKEKQFCRNFTQFGTCKYGERCHFSHGNSNALGHTPKEDDRTCFTCDKKGHISRNCPTKKKRLDNAANSKQTTLVSNDEDDDLASSLQNASMAPPIVLVFTTADTPTLSSCENNCWVCDSGATSSATYDPNDCIDIVECKTQVTAAGCTFDVEHKGTAILKVVDIDGLERELRITNCLISSKFPYKLLALQQFTNKGFSVLIQKQSLFFSNDDLKLRAQLEKRSRLFMLKTESRIPISEKQLSDISSAHPTTQLIARSYSVSNESELWKLHLKHGHRNFLDLCRQYSMPVPPHFPVCGSCIQGKSHLYPHDVGTFQRANRPGEGFHSDFRGPFSVPTPQGALYLLTIIDDFSRRIFGYLVKTQTDWYSIFQSFVVRIEAELGRPNCISWLLTDNGAVYSAKEMETFYASKGIQHRLSAPYSQWMDHTAERNMRTIGEMQLTTIIHANMPKRAWGWAAMYAIEVLNRTCDAKEINEKAKMPVNFSRLEKWRGMAIANLTRCLFPFGCLAYKHVPGAIRSKLDPHAVPMVFLGIDAQSKAYLLGSLKDLSTSVSVEVTFVEDKFPLAGMQHREEETIHLPTTGAVALPDVTAPAVAQIPVAPLIAAQTPTKASITTPQLSLADDVPREIEPVVALKPQDVWRQALSSEVAVAPTATQQGEVADPPMVRRSARLAAQSSLNCSHLENALSLDEESVLVTLTEATLDRYTPRTAHDAMRSPDAAKWIAAMQREKDCHLKNQTFGALRPHNVKDTAIPCDWVFRIKHRGGAIESKDLSEKQFKARVVIRGQYMQAGLNYNETFAPVAKPATIRSVFALAAKYGCLLFSGDVETAFLASPMDCVVHVRMPPYWGKDGEEITGNARDSDVRILLKGVPGIPQGSRLFWETISKHLATMGYVASSADKCLFVNPSIKERNAVLLWVDDFVYCCQTQKASDYFISKVRDKFTVPSYGPLNSFLGMTVSRNLKEKYICLCQSNTIQVLLERAKMVDCNPAATPCVAGTVFTKKDCPKDPAENPLTTDYRSLIALLNFISVWTRPDITFTVNKYCKFMGNPGEAHWRGLKHLLRFMKGTMNWSLKFSMEEGSDGSLIGFSDSSFGDCVDTGRSTLAYVFTLGGAIISWYSKLNTFVTLSTNHSEYSALALAAREAEWLIMLFSDLDPGKTLTPVPILVDNSGVVSLVFNPVHHKANKNLRLSCHYARELTEARKILPKKVSTENNLADLFTKPLPLAAFSKLAHQLVTPHTNEEKVFMMHTSEENNQQHSTDSDKLVDPVARPYMTMNEEFKGMLDKYGVPYPSDYETSSEEEEEALWRLELGEKRSEEGKPEIIRPLKSRVTRSMLRRERKEAGFPPDSPPTPPPTSYPYGPSRVPTLAEVEVLCLKKKEEERNDLSSILGKLPDPTSQIKLKVPSALLQCTKCGLANSPAYSSLRCGFCSSSLFTWSCSCIVQPLCACALDDIEKKEKEAEQKEVSNQQQSPQSPTNVPRRSKRTSRFMPPARSYTPRVCFIPPAKRGGKFHLALCAQRPPGNYVYAGIEFALGLAMVGEPCCCQPPQARSRGRVRNPA